VEERPFEGRVTKRKKENNSTLPKAVAGERSSQATAATTDERRYEKLSGEAKEQVLSELKAEQDSGNLHYASQDDARIFHALAKAGQRLAEIHIHYEQQPEYKLTKVEKPGEKLDYRVEKMKLSKDKTSLIYNKFLTLSGIPPETYEYRLGNRSALEWIVDQYQVSTDKRSGITNDPNREDDREYILRLIGKTSQ
jgi:predicted helicase